MAMVTTAIEIVARMSLTLVTVSATLLLPLM
jgi:hypothetical protein